MPLLQPVHRFPLTTFYSEWLAFALGLAAAAPLLRREAWRDAALPVVALAPLGLIGVLVLQVALGRVPYAGQAMMAVLYLAWALLLIVLGQWLRREVSLGEIARLLAWFLAAGGLLNALAGLAQHYGFHPPPLDVLVMRKQAPVIYGNLGQTNHYAVSVALALASVVYLHGRRDLHGFLAAGAAALFLLVLALSGSRSPWLYIAVLAVLAWRLDRVQASEQSRRLLRFAVWLLPGFVAAQGAAFLPFLQPPDDLILVSLERLFAVAEGIESRLQLSGEACRIFIAFPLLGAGFGQFAWEHFLQQAATGATAAPGVFNHAHNVIMQLLAETGITGTLIVAVAAICWIADLRRVNFDAEWWWLLALLSVIGIHSLLEYPLWYAYFLGIAALLLGLGTDRGILLGRGGIARVAAALIVLAGIFNLAAVLPPYRDFERLVFSPTSASLSRDKEAFAAAVMRAHRDPLLEPYVELALALGAPPEGDDLPERLALNTRAMRFAPVSAVAYRQALLLALARERDAALMQLARALRVYPEEAAAFTRDLENAARRYPGEVGPLLELATAKLAPRDAREQR